MSFTLLWMDGNPLLKTASPVLDAEDVRIFPDLAATLAAARARAADVDAELQRVLEEARAEGLRRGREDAAVELRREMFDLYARAERERGEMRASVARLVAAAMRRVADELGGEVMIAGIAARAVRELAADAPLKVRVAPRYVAAVRQRLTKHTTALDVAGDASLGEDACLIETQFGRIEAGLDQQVRAIEAALAKEASDDAA